jgi:hypothetical protein
MANVIIEVGRTYVDRKGRAHTIDRHTPAEAYVEDAKGLSWKAGGISWQHPDLDLVGLAVEDARNHTSQPEPIPHADLIRAVLDGKTVQWEEDGQWLSYKSGDDAICDLVRNPSRFGYRLKPEPVVSWHAVFSNGFVEQGYAAKREIPDCACRKVLRLELDPDTLDVLSARAEAP